ncbi:hypothetical protein [Actinomadura sp. NPDC049753]|uniref:hypothetical protein n=1 Tax=Actinomadura sp. NPDC049753 TaxID=3154739 RepID=UPI0034314BC2
MLAAVADLSNKDFSRGVRLRRMARAGPGVDALLVGTGRRAPTAAERADMGHLAAQVPFILG